MSYRRPPAPRSAPPRAPHAVFSLSADYRATVAAASYLGTKGYTIPKSALAEPDIALLRKELMLAPELSGPSYGAVEAAFPVYRENTNKMYIPRFYGVSRYGPPARSEIHASVERIDVDFAKPLRDYQNEIADVYMRHIAAPLTSAIGEDTGNGGILEVKTGRGKCLAHDTPVLMFDGDIKMSQDIAVGDQLMGDDSAPRNVLSLARGREMMYRVHDRCHEESYTVNESHILSLEQSYVDFNSDGTTVKIVACEKIDISVLAYLDAIDGREESTCIRGYRVPVVFPEVALKMDSYMLGCWLGARCARIDSVNIAWTGLPGAFAFLDAFPDPPHARIPREHKCNSRANQLQLLAGVLDACGEYNSRNNCYYILLEYAPFAADLKFLVRSLGFVANDFGERDVLCFGGSNVSDVPVRTPGLVAKSEKMYVRAMESELSYVLEVEKLEEGDYFGFEIDGNRRFILGDCTVTHNTVIALKLVSQIKQKTLIIVHKEFLADQWKERIEEFLPGASVGRIQGSAFDVEGRDIVIGMVQTLYNRPFADNAFSGFGLTIVDEVHRIGSEEFSKTLLRVATPHMLGISATVNRKDGLEKLLYMFMGAKIYKDDSASEDPVCVRVIHYSHADPEYNEPILDFRGNPAFSSMVARLCAASHRSDFLVRVLADLVEESPQAQIMVLAHQRNLLTYLYAAIEHRKIASVGYYVGGSKPAVLKETEGKQIVLATFSMAAEALDIKTLSTLFMVTPKSDIVQSVGRILRAKHATPIIVDIVDSLSVFKNQFVKRRQFYKSNNYRIRSIECGRYAGFADMRGWKSVFEPRGGAVPAAREVAAASDSDDDDVGDKRLGATCEITLSAEDLRLIAE
jgi:superfamily II DNA or RNA helicase